MPQLDLVNIPYIPYHIILAFLMVFLVYLARSVPFILYKPEGLVNTLLPSGDFSFINFYLDFLFLNECRHLLSTEYLLINK
jgi:hypothetical protein